MNEDQAVNNPDPRKCTCHPDDKPPVPCPRKYALTDCRVAELLHAVDHVICFDNDPERRDNAMTGARLTFGEIRRLRRAADALARWR